MPVQRVKRRRSIVTRLLGTVDRPEHRRSGVRKVAAAASLAAVLAFQVQPVSAGTYYWDTTTGAWSDGTSWTLDPTGAPDADANFPTITDLAVFNGSGNSTAVTDLVNLTAAAGALGLNIVDTGTLTIQSSSTTAQTLSIGASGMTIAAGSGAVTIGSATNAANLALTAAQTWTNNSSSGLTVVNGLGLGATTLTFAGTGTTTLSGVISGTAAAGSTALAVNGGTVIVGGATNTFTGNITVDGATSALQINSGSNGTATSGVLGIFAGGTAYKTVSLTNGGTFRTTATFNDNGVTAALPGAGFVFLIGTGGGRLDVASGTTLTIDDGSGAGTAPTNAQIQGAGQLTKIGAGTLSLGNNTSNYTVFTGTLLVSAGTLTTGAASTNPFGTGGVTLNGGSLDLRGITFTTTTGVTVFGSGNGTNNAIYGSTGTGTYIGPITLGSNATIGGGAGAIVLSGAIGAATSGFSLTNAGAGVGTTTLSGVIGATVGPVIQTSTTSSLTLSGANVAFAGGLVITRGNAILATNATAAGTAAITLGNTVADTNAATLTLNGNTTTTYANAINVVSGTTGTLSIASTSGNYTLSGLVTLANNLTLTNTNSANAQVFNFTGGFAGAGNLTLNSTSNSGVTISSTLNNTGTITNSGAGNGLATISGVVGTGISAITQNSATSQTIISGNNSANTAAVTTITNGVLTFLATNSMFGYPTPTTGKITVSATGTLGLGFGSAGQFTSADLANVVNGTLPVTVAAGGSIGLDTTTASATLSTNVGDFTGGPSAGVALNLSKLGGNVLTLAGTNTYTGNTVIRAGILTAVEGVSLPTTSLLNINALASNGASAASYAPFGGGTFTRTLGIAPGQVQLAGGNSGFTALGGGLTVNLGGGTVVWGSAAFTPTGLLLNDAAATAAIEFQNNIDLGAAARAVAVNSTTAGTAATLSGVLSGTGGGITKTGAGTLNVLNPTNTYTGGSIVSAGVLSFNGTGALPAASAVGLNGGTFQVLNDGSGIINYGNAVGATANTTINVGNNGGGTTGSTIAFGALSSPTTATNTGLTLTFNGSNGYNTSFTSLALPGGSGATTVLTANNNVIIGSGGVTNRGTGSATNFDTLTLQGTSTGSAINGVIADAPAKSLALGNYTPVTKAGTGTWTLSAANTYTGGTSVNAGTLQLQGSAAGTTVIGASTVLVNGGTLGISSNVNIGTGTTLNGNGTASSAVTQGTVGVGTTAAGTLSLLDNSINTLTILGTGFTGATTFLTVGGATTAGTLSFDLGNDATDQIVVTPSAVAGSGKVVVGAGGAVINLNQLTGTSLVTGKSYTLINYTAGGTLTGAFTLGSFTGLPGQVYTLSNTGTAEILTVTAGAGAANAFWKGNVSAVWNAGSGTATNFTTDFAGTTGSALPDVATNVFFTSANAANFSNTLGQTFTINSLNFTGTGSPAATNAVTIGGTNALTLNAGAGFTDQNGVAYAAGVGLVVQPGSAAHTISAPLVLGSSQSFEIDNALASPLTVSGVVSGNFRLTKTGTGGLTLSATNTFSGGLTITGGAVNFTVDANLGATTGGIILNGGTLNSTAIAGTVTLAAGRTITVGAAGGTLATAGAGTAGKISITGSQLIGSGTFTKTGGGDLQISGAATNFSGQFNVAGLVEDSSTGALGTGTVSINTGGELQVSNAASLTNPLIFNGGTIGPIGGALVIPATTTINAVGNFTIATRAFNTTTNVFGVTIAAPISGSGNLSGFTVGTSATNNQQVVLLSGNNSAWSGNISTTGGSASNGILLRLGSTTALGNSTGGTTIAPNSTLDLNGITLANDEPLTLSGTGSSSFPTTLTNQSATAATFSGPITLASNILLGNTTGGNFTLSGVISGGFGISKGFLATQLVTFSGLNTYTGPTTITLGTLSVNTLANGGVASGIGASTSAAANLVLSGGTLQYTGTGATTDRNFTLGNATTAVGGGIDAEGTGPLVITGNLTGVNVTAGTQVLTLTAGAGSGANALNGTVSDSSATSLTGVTKAGAGSWTLGGANAYGGLTTVSAGTLVIAGTNTGTAGVGGAYTIANTGVLTINSSGTVLGSTLTFASGATANLNGGVLALTGNVTAAAGTTGLFFNGGTLKNNSTGAITISGSLPIAILAGGGTVDTTGGNITSASAFGNTASPGSLNVIGGHTLATALGTPLAGTVNVTGAGTTLAFSTASTPAAAINIGAGAFLDLNNLSNSVGGLAGSGTVINTAGAAAVKTLTLTGTGGNNFAGAIAPAGTTAAFTGLTVNLTSGTQTFSGAVSHTYTGPTTINGGTLAITAGTLDNTAVSVNAGATGPVRTLAVVPGTANSVINIGNTATAGAGATLTLGGGSAANSIGSAFTMVDNAIGTVNLLQNASFAGNALTLGGAAAAGYVKPNLSFDLGGSSLTDIDVLNISKLVSVGSGGATINFAPLSTATSLTPGQYVFINASGGLGSSAAVPLTLGNATLLVGSTNYQLSLDDSTATQEILTISALAGNAQSYWQGGIDASWKTINGQGDTNFVTTPAGTTNTKAIPDASSNVTFTANVASRLNTTLDQDFAINSLTFSGTGTSNTAGTTIGSGVGGPFTLTINATGANGNVAGNGITVATGSGPDVITSKVALGASQNWTVATGTSLAVSGDVSGDTFGITALGGGTITLSGNNTFTGGVVLNGPTLNINSATAVGTGPITLATGTLDNTVPFATQTLANNNAVTLVNGGSVSFTGTNALNLGTGEVTFGDAATGIFTLTNNSALTGTSLTLGGAITPGTAGTAGVKTLVIAGAGGTTLSGNITKGTATGLVITDTSPATLNLSGATSSISTLNVNGGQGSIVDIGAGNVTINNGGGDTIQSSTGGTINATGGGSIILGVNALNGPDNGTANATTLTINAKVTGNSSFEFFRSGVTTGVIVLNNPLNNFSGDLVLNAGIISTPTVANIGSPSGIGSGTNLQFSTGVLRYTGTGGTTDRVINLYATTGGGTIDQSGTGNLKFTANLATPGAGSKTLTLQGSTAGTGEIAGIIKDNSAAFTTGVTKLGTGTWTLSGANTYSGTTTVGVGTLAFGVNQTLAGGLTFGAANAATNSTLDLSTADATFGGALLVQTNSTTPNAITVGVGHTLAINNNVTIGNNPSATLSTAGLTIGGGGAFAVTTAAAGTFQVGGATAGNSQTATLDLTGLRTATINTSATGTIRVNNPTGTNVVGNQSALLLPTPTTGVLSTTPVTTLTAGSLNVGDNGGNNGGAGQINSVVLGTGLTTLNINTINIGTGTRDLGSITVAPGNGTVFLRGAAGDPARALVNIGTGTATTGVAVGAGLTGNVIDLTGHSANLLISTLTIGNQTRNATNANDFKFDTGTLDVTGVVIGADTSNANATNSPTITSTLSIGGGTTTVGTGGVDLGTVTNTSTGARTNVGVFNVTGGTVSIGTTGVFSVRLGNNTAATATTNDTFSVTGGTVTLAGDVVAGSTTRTTNALTLNGGTLDLTGHNIGGTTLIGNLNFQSGTLQNVAQINNGAGLTKTTAGTLVLAGTNTYTGPTTITGGILAASADANLGAATSNLSIGAGTLRTTAGVTTNRQVTLTNAASTILVDAAAVTTVSGKVTGGGVLNVAGAGKLALTGAVANDYTGGTNIAGGSTLLADNAVNSTGTAAVTVQNGGTLAGTGKVGGAVTLTSGATVGGIIGAGNSATDTAQTAQLALAGALTFGNNSSYVWKINNALTPVGPGAAGTATGTGTSGGYDVISAPSVALSPGATFRISIVGGANFPVIPVGSSQTYTYELIQTPNTAAVDPALLLASNVVFDAPGLDASQFRLQLDPGGTTLTGGALSTPGIDLVYTNTPEPVVTSLIGLTALGLLRRPGRRQRRILASIA